MFSYEERREAVELYNKVKSISIVINTLGYPTKNALRAWVKEFNTTGALREVSTRTPKYTEEQIQIAVDYYCQYGRNISKTIRELGYPSRIYLKQWLIERDPDFKCSCRKGTSLIQLSQEEKTQAVIELCAKKDTAKTVAKKYGVDRVSLYNWKYKLLGDKKIKPMPKCNKTNIEDLQDEIIKLRIQAEELKQQVYRLQLEKDVLEVASEIIKKDQGITLEILTNKEKAIVIDTLRAKYKLKELLSVFRMAKSSYCYHALALKSPDKYEKERQLIKKFFDESNNTYGYRRINLDLRDAGIRMSEKVVRRIMKQENLVVVLPKRKRYNSYMGEISPAVDNVINRDFHASKPNEKWLTDITEFHIPSGKVYLSPIIDCFDGLPVSWTIGIHPNAELVNTMLDEAINTLNKDEKPLVHSDRGAHYRWSGWIERMDNANLTRSMSKKGCSPDNSACEGFFGRLKNEMFYNYNWKGVSIKDFIERLDNYMHWYAEKRRKLSLNGMSPMQYRKSLGLIV